MALVRTAALVAAAGLSVVLATAIPRLTASAGPAPVPSPSPAAVVPAAPVTAPACVAAPVPGPAAAHAVSLSLELAGRRGEVFSATGGGACGPLILTKPLDVTSARLLRDSLTGRIEPRAAVTVRDGRSELVTIVLTGVRVSSVRDDLGPSGATEQVVLEATRIRWTFRPAGHLCWDFSTAHTC